jgi:transposase
MRKTTSLDLRERILDCYDKEDATRAQVAKRFRVSLGLVQKLLAQRRRTPKDIGPQHHRSGRKPLILGTHKRQLRALLAKKSDLTLRELREAVGLSCTLPAIHYALAAMGLTYKKRHSARPSKTGPTSKKRAGRGGGGKPASIPRG